MSLFEEFKISSEEEWTEKIQKDLKEKPISSLIWNSSIGEINPAIFSKESKHQSPGNSPFTRGLNHSNSWNIAQHVDANQNNANQLALNALKGGANYILFSNFKSDTNYNRLFENIQLEIIHTAFILENENAVATLKAFLAVNTNKNIPFTVFFDPIGEMLQKGIKLNYQGNLKEIIELLQAYPNAKINLVNGSIYTNSGATEEKQIALTAAHLNEYLNEAEANETLSLLENKLVITVGVGTTYFMEIAKARAYRKVITTVLETYKLKKSPDYFAETATLYYSKMDNYSNLLRATTQAMSAVIGGYNNLLVFPYDLKFEDQFGNRIAQNIQLILQEEGHLNHVVDPAGGAYFIEELTDQLINKSWAYFQKIEQKGGLINEISTNAVQKAIEEDWNNLLSKMKQDEKIMIGVNKFINNLEDFTPEDEMNSSSSNNEFTPVTRKRLAEFFEKNTVENA